MTVPWTLTDTTVPTTYTFDVNPGIGQANADPPYSHNVVADWGSTALSMVGATAQMDQDLPMQGSFDGVILNAAQYNALVSFWKADHSVVLVDDLGRSFTIYITEFQPQRVRMQGNDLYHTYTVRFYYTDMVKTGGWSTPSAVTAHAYLVDFAYASDSLLNHRPFQLADSAASVDDMLVRSQYRSRTAGDGAAAADGLVHAFNNPRPLADAAAAADVLARSVVQYSRSISDGAAASDVLSALNRNVHDNAAASDVLVRTSLSLAGRSIADNAAASDAIDVTLTAPGTHVWLRPLHDNAAASDGLFAGSGIRTLHDFGASPGFIPGKSSGGATPWGLHGSQDGTRLYGWRTNTSNSHVEVGYYTLATYAWTMVYDLGVGSNISGIVVDASGNIYFADNTSSLKQISSGGALNSTWCNISGTDAYTGDHLSRGGDGNMYVHLIGNTQDSVGKVTFSGTFTDITALQTTAFYFGPVGADASGNVYVAEEDGVTTGGFSQVAIDVSGTVTSYNTQAWEGDVIAGTSIESNKGNDTDIFGIYPGPTSTSVICVMYAYYTQHDVTAFTNTGTIDDTSWINKVTSTGTTTREYGTWAYTDLHAGDTGTLKASTTASNVVDGGANVGLMANVKHSHGMSYDLKTLYFFDTDDYFGGHVYLRQASPFS